MKPLITKILPARGFSQLAHMSLVALLPLLLFVVLRSSYLGLPLALVLILLSKWRMFAMRPRFWPAIIRANSLDIMVGVSVVAFMYSAGDQPFVQFLWVLAYAAWLLLLKPGTGIFLVSAQAFVGQLAGLVSLYLVWSDGPLYGLVISTALICYISARHFFDSFDEPYSKMLAYLWAYFGGALAWVLGHWLLFYAFVSQPTLILTIIGYGLAVLYYFDHYDKLTIILRRQMIAVMLVVLIFIIVFADWRDKVV